MTLRSNLIIASACCGLLASTAAVAADSNFDVSIQLKQDITVTTIDNLIFPDQIAATAHSYTLSPNDTGHAELEATGTTNEEATGSFAKDSINLSCVLNSGACTAATPPIVVGSFTCGGDLVAGSTCDYKFNAQQKATIDVGATETTTAANTEGTYKGTQTFTINYK